VGPDPDLVGRFDDFSLDGGKTWSTGKMGTDEKLVTVLGPIKTSHPVGRRNIISPSAEYKIEDGECRLWVAL